MKIDETNWQLLAELMKNSKISDRALAKKLAVSQPTITRRRTKLEEQGIIREYTMIPDFTKLGYELLAITLLNTKLGINKEEMEKTRQAIQEGLEDSSLAFLMVERGKGFGSEGITITLHEDYEAYNKFRLHLRETPFLEPHVKSFLISLKDEIRYLPLTLHKVAKHILTLNQK